MWPFSRKGSSGFSSYSTAEEVTDGLDGSGLTAIVTGGSSGLGAETARVLAMRGIHVIMTGRNMDAGRKFKEAIEKEVPGAKVDVKELDLSSMASVRQFASNFLAQNLPLNILINNAGIMGAPFTLSKDNIELHFATNHIGHFLLTNLLLDIMKKTARESGKEGRILNISSSAHSSLLAYSEGIRFDKINDQTGYTGFKAYCQSKLANILHANELAKHLKEEEVNITVNSVHPGVILTNIVRNISWAEGLIKVLGKLVSPFFKNAQQGAATTCYVALHPQVEGVTGQYFADSNISKPSLHARNAEMAKKLWDLSMDLIK